MTTIIMMAQTDMDKKFKYLLNIAEQNSNKLSEQELKLQIQLQEELVENEYIPDRTIVTKAEFEFACALSQLNELSAGMEQSLSGKSKFILNYVISLDQACRHHFLRHSHPTEWTPLLAAKN
jgi:hypothetical protein